MDQAAGGGPRPRITTGCRERTCRPRASRRGFDRGWHQQQTQPRGAPWSDPRPGHDFAAIPVHPNIEGSTAPPHVSGAAERTGGSLVRAEGHEPDEGATGSPPPTATAPTTGTASALSGVAGWTDCPSDEIEGLNQDLADATSWVRSAIADLSGSPRPSWTDGALARYLSTDPADISETILPALRGILAELEVGPSNFRCQTDEACKSATGVDADAYASRPITLCGRLFGFLRTHLERSTILIHEAGHLAGLHGDVYEWKWPFPGLDVATRLSNADSFAAFVRSNQYPEVPPYESPLGARVGVGVLAPGALVPRFAVRAEFDVAVARRVFRFIDLHVGSAISVDTEGSVISATTLGARVFTAPSLPDIPMFLDLRAGFAYGKVAGFEEIGQREDMFNVVGVSGDMRIGVLSGHWGISADYRHIVNLMKDYPDVDEVYLTGEIRFP